MQQNVFKTEFPVLFDTVKTENVQYLEEKMLPIEKIAIENIQKKIALNFNFKKSKSIFVKISSMCLYSTSAVSPHQIWYQ